MRPALQLNPNAVASLGVNAISELVLELYFHIKSDWADSFGGFVFTHLQRLVGLNSRPYLYVCSGASNVEVLLGCGASAAGSRSSEIIPNVPVLGPVDQPYHYWDKASKAGIVLRTMFPPLPKVDQMWGLLMISHSCCHFFG